MNLSRNFTLLELIKSDTAVRKGYQQQSKRRSNRKTKRTCVKIFYNPFGTILVELKSHQVSVQKTCAYAIGSSRDSQHAKAEAADFECVGVDNAEVADWIKTESLKQIS